MPDIIEYLDRLKREAKQIEDEVMSIALFGLGGFSWEECWTLSQEQRIKIAKKLNDYYKKRSGDTREYM